MTNPTGGTPPGKPLGSDGGFQNPIADVQSLGSGLGAIGAFFSNLGILGGWLAHPVRMLKFAVGLLLLGAALVVTFLPEAAAAVTGAATGNVAAGEAVEHVLRGRPRQAGAAAARGAARSIKAQAREVEAVSRERARVRATEARRAQEQEARRVAEARRQRDVFHAGAGERQPKARKPVRNPATTRFYQNVINRPGPAQPARMRGAPKLSARSERAYAREKVRGERIQREIRERNESAEAKAELAARVRRNRAIRESRKEL